MPRLRIAILLALAAGPGLAGVPFDRAVELHQRGELARAEKAYREILAADPDPATRSDALNNLCVLLVDRGDYRAALPECRAATELRRPGADRAATAQSLNNLALALGGAGDPEGAIAALGEATAINREQGLDEEVAVDLGNLAALRIDQGRYGAALDLLAEAERFASSKPDAPWAEEQLRVTALNRGVVLERLGAWRESLALLRPLAARGDADPLRRARIEVDLGVVYRNLGDPRRAARAFESAAGRFARQGVLGDRANALLNLGLARELGLGETAAAAEAYESALALARQGGDREIEIRALVALTRVAPAGDRGRLAESAIALAREGADSDGLWAALDARARIALAAGDEAAALADFRAAIEVVRAQRAESRRWTESAGIVTDRRRLFADAVELAARRALRSGTRDDARSALAVAVDARGRELLDAVGYDLPGGDALFDSLAAAPRTVLDYELGSESLWRFELGRGTLKLARLGSATEATRLALAAHEELARGGGRADLSRLGRLLLGGLDALPDELVISPHLRLRYVPFDALPAPDGRPLVEHAATRLVPSVAWLGATHARRPDTAPARLLALAPAAAQPPSPGRVALLASRLALRPLPRSAEEVRRVAAQLGLPAEILVAERATPAALRAGLERGASYLHLATHAAVDETLAADGAAILLAPDPDGTTLLDPRAIARLPLAGTFVVLAACSTALGGSDDGRALDSLVGSFLAAGASGVVASLWDVGDRATSAFMEQFAWELGRGRTPADALRRVKLRLASTPGWDSPAIWSAFVLAGDPPALVARPARSPARRIAAGFGVVAAALGVWAAARYRMRRGR